VRNVRVLGVDPGSAVTGWGLLEQNSRGPRLIDCGMLKLDVRRPFAVRLHRLRTEFDELVERLRPTAAAVEAPFHGASARSALQLAHARGVILAALAGSGLEVAEYAPARIKKAVAGAGRADKDQVRAMVCRLLGRDLPAGTNDMSDALAVALCHLAESPLRDAVNRAERRARARGPALDR
jgi:crossover junction endodeoxyribonuclease RuvC